MFRFIVRSKRDADAVKAMVSRFYRGWGVEVETLGGVRGDKLAERIMELRERRGFNIVLLGREDSGVVKAVEELPPNTIVHEVPRARVRNTRLEMLFIETLKARAKLRLAVSWSDEHRTYLLGAGGIPLEGYRYEPSYDLIPGLGSVDKLISRLAGGPVGRDPLIVRASGGLHLVYNGPRLRAVYHVSDQGFRPRAEIKSGPVLDNSWVRSVSVNMDRLSRFVDASKDFLEKYSDYDTVIVPWSGGKDSTAALLLALEVFGRKRVRVVFGDTGTEFPQTVEYVEKVSRIIGVDYVVAYAGLDRALASGAPLPSHDNRWCTGRKIEAIENTVKKIAEGKTLIVVGDRDAESPSRSDRPPVRTAQFADFTVVAPLKPWSGLHVVLYILSKGIPLNPLYEMGFYRIGCYMCPALRDWELNIMLGDNRLYMRLLSSRVFRRFIHSRLYRRRERVGGGEENPG